ncbi:tetrahydroberberine oxidase-like [Humulus lupulus]|uniref:tetrahydroberberine oxidase-like n=1 Tax=Humulus lupulus TaxID=3486 RepID=UPI002B413FC2|nr:tetrahydroberberine oxidase-like [Humulus lupulus]
MKSEYYSIFPSILLYLALFFWSSLADSHNDFVQCFSQQSPNSTLIVFTQNDTSYLSVLNLSIQNPRFSSTSTPKPLVIITPLDASHVQTTICCSKKHGLQIRVRSGGHDYEGLSYVSDVPFVVLDLINLRSVNVDFDDKTASVQAGATIGEVYYKIAENSRCLGFPSATANTVGVGGLFSGGGYGAMLRKHGLSVDHIIDAQFVNFEGRILDRKTMGEDLFWAIRGGGGASFGVIISWKIRLVLVPKTVTVFTVNRNLEQKVTELVHKWQFVAERFEDDLFILVRLQALMSSNGVGNSNNKTIQASFISLFLGGVDRLLPLMKRSFPELGLVREDCKEMSWIESVVYFAGFPSGSSPVVLLDRTTPIKVPIKGKSDYVKVPISVDGLEGIWKRLFEEKVGRTFIQMTPYGGRMKEIPDWETPFPHRAGNIYMILYLVAVIEEEGINVINWIRRLYDYMTPYVSKNPREAYLNYRDLDIGTNNNNGTTSYAQASIWGLKYFKNNFNRLLRVKNMIDPTNFFRNEQSIPPYAIVGSK